MGSESDSQYNSLWTIGGVHHGGVLVAGDTCNVKALEGTIQFGSSDSGVVQEGMH